MRKRLTKIPGGPANAEPTLPALAPTTKASIAPTPPSKEQAEAKESGLSRRLSTRKLINVFLTRARKRGKEDAAGTAPPSVTATKTSNATPPRAPRPPPDPNKPLPSPPRHELQQPNAPQVGQKPAALKLERIMATLTEEEIEQLFSGAPQYFARSERFFPGAPHPSVAFPFDEELEIRDLTDHVHIADKAWSGITAWPHLTRDVNHDAAAKRQAEEKHKAHFHIRCRERPNMLSMQGLEKGTMGYQAALELPVGDSLEEEQFGFDSIGTKARIVLETRERIMSDLGSLRRLPEAEILDRLKRNGELYKDNDLRSRTSVDTYKDLFHTFMRPCKDVVDKTDHYSLNNQINALVKCLGSPNVWLDLSRVEWRIRLGQILWGESDGDELDDATSIHDAETAKERSEEKYWLLMQILVSTELLLRLDAITEGKEYGVESLRPIDVVQFERAANLSVKWSLLLARSWLENIDVVKTDIAPADAATETEHKGSSWLASLGRQGQRQVDGLIHFARRLRWPGIDTYETRITENAQDAAGGTPTPVASPNTISTTQSSYFGTWDISHHGHSGEKAQAQRRKLAAALHASGWISKTYVFGLILPGEALSHYLMATLLENDTEALTRLGSLANLCGGFVYAGKSFWSTSCIVGRVLAAGRGSAECMGWVSTDIIPQGFGEGWVNIEVENVADDLAQLGKKARLWGKKRVERDSNILGDGDEDSVLPADFIIPHENGYTVPPPGVLVDLRALELLSATDSLQATPFSDYTATPATGGSRDPELVTYPANISFSVSINGAPETEYTFSLSYDISLVTAHPCAPSSRVRFLSSPTSPTIQQIDISGSDMFGKYSRPAVRTGHPLHKFYNYTVVHISELLEKPHTSLSELISTPISHKPGHGTGRSGQIRVLVIDCITNYTERPMSPTLQRSDSTFSSSSPILERMSGFAAEMKMHLESRKRQFGSDMEILLKRSAVENVESFRLWPSATRPTPDPGPGEWDRRPIPAPRPPSFATLFRLESQAIAMAPPNKDARRPDLIVPYQEPTTSGEPSDFGGAISSTLPMAAMFTRNKFIGWAAAVYAVQNWLSESEESRKKAATPGYFNVMMAVMALAVSYLPLFLPPTAQGGSSTSPPAPVPLQ
ncbi:hypothetical protein HJFPF1_04892 [Paramyrothecium foliicola]|nr:hypothetical protein HJFPF1_04892 [Paramyrothecium foliicola]